MKHEKNSLKTVHNANQQFIDAVQNKVSEYISGKAMPQAPELEEAIIGAIILHADAISVVKSILLPDHFYNENYRLVYKAALDLDDRNKPIDLLTIAESLRSKSITYFQDPGESKSKTRTTILQKIGGPSFLVECTNRVTGGNNIEYHAHIVIQKFLAREAINNCWVFVQKFYDDGGGAEVFNLRNRFSEIMRAPDFNSYFATRSANKTLEHAKNLPALYMMIGQFWRKSQIAFLFGVSGTGKSILAVQISEAIASGADLFPGIVINECEPMVVLYIDFELSDKQFASRYSDSKDERFYQFSEFFYRATINEDFLDYRQNMDAYIIHQIEHEIINTKADVVILDNITYISQESTDPAVATKIMKKLKGLKNKYRVSLLVIGHTPKRNATLPLTNDDLAGSSNLVNFADSIFAVGKDANDDNIKYIKQTKVRDGSPIYTADNVIKCAIDKDSDFFLRHNFIEMAKEDTMLLKFFDDDAEEAMILEAIELKNKGNSWRTIAPHFNHRWHWTTIRRKVIAYVEENELGTKPAWLKE